MHILAKAFKYIRPLLSPRAFFPTVIFNFRYLPFKQAIMLPVWVYGFHFIKMKGTVRIEGSTPPPDYKLLGMIRLGFMGGRAYPNNGIRWSNEGEIVFRGRCRIGNNSAIITGKDGYIEFGDDFLASSSVKFYSFTGMKFGNHVIFGWDSIVMDTDFHPLYDMSKESFRKGYGPIDIGDDNWFSQGCLVLNSVKTPQRCIFGARSVVTRKGEFKSYALHMGTPLKPVLHNVCLDYDHYMITEYTRHSF